MTVGLALRQVWACVALVPTVIACNIDNKPERNIAIAWNMHHCYRCVSISQMDWLPRSLSNLSCIQVDETNKSVKKKVEISGSVKTGGLAPFCFALGLGTSGCEVSDTWTSSPSADVSAA